MRIASLASSSRESAASVKVTEAHVQGQCEVAMRSPLEAVACATRGFDHRVAVPLEDVDDLLKEMLLKDGGAARWDL